MTSTWRLCYDCKARMDRLDRTRQTYTSSLALIEVVSNEEDTKAKSRTTETRHWCTQCQLKWTREQTQGTAARALEYRSEFTPNPTDSQAMANQGRDYRTGDSVKLGK